MVEKTGLDGLVSEYAGKICLPSSPTSLPMLVCPGGALVSAPSMDTRVHTNFRPIFVALGFREGIRPAVFVPHAVGDGI